MRVPFARNAIMIACAAAVTGALTVLPAAAFAEEIAPPPDAAVASAPTAEPAAPEPVAPAPAAPAPAAPEPAPVTDPPAAVADPVEPADVVVAPAGATPEEVFAESPDGPTVTLFAAEEPAATLPEPGDPCYPAVCIDNGTVLLAVNPTGELNTDDATGSPAGPGDAGLGYLPTNNDSTSPGCLCEGWGVADPATGVWGGANLAELGTGGENLVLESFEWTGSTAKSVVLVTDEAEAPYFRVTHEYIPSADTPNLYQVNVTIENLSGEPIATVQYRRVMDWDVEPTAFDEFVTIDGGTASALTYTSDDGFASPNPLEGPSEILFHGNAVDSGPDDHGALFDFSFGGLAPGASLSFIIFYGAAESEAGAQAALAAVGAEAYSFGETSDDPEHGTPNTFIFAFGHVGGSAIFPSPTAAPAVPAVSAVVAPAVVTAVVAPPAAATLAATGMSSSEHDGLGSLGLAGLLIAGFGGVLIAVRVVVARAHR